MPEQEETPIYLPDKFTAKLKQLEDLQQASQEADKRISAFVRTQIFSIPNPEDLSKYNKEESREYQEFLNKSLQGRVLDIASGPTKELDDFVSPNNQVIYLDVTKQTLPNTDSVLADANSLPFTDNSFETIFTRAFIHGDRPTDKEHFGEMVRTLKPGGLILILGSASLEDVLYMMPEFGVNLDNQVNIDIFNNVSIHQLSGIRVNAPQAIISVRPKPLSSHS